MMKVKRLRENEWYVYCRQQRKYLRDDMTVHDAMCGDGGTYFSSRGEARAAADKWNAMHEENTPKLWKDMTDEEKGALLLAHHEGKVIEWNARIAVSKEWMGWRKCNDDNLWNGDYAGEGFAYRVKPEPVRGTVTLYSHSLSSAWSSERDEFDTHRITFDLVDGKPDCDSIKMREIAG